MKICVWISLSVYLTATRSVQQPADQSIVETADNSSSGATETQQATCQVVTEKLVATASATVTHALKGVCSTKDLEKHFLNLQNEVSNQLNAVKSMLLDISQQLTALEDTLDQESDENYHQSHQLPLKKEPRDFEVDHLNNTIHHNEQGDKVFSYYWRIDGIRNKLTQSKQHVAFRSSSFYVNNTYRMYIELFLHQEKGNIYIHVGLTRGDFDSLLSWPFRLKHQVSVLDQGYGGTEGLASRVWDPTSLCGPSDWQQPITDKDSEQCVGFGFNQETVFTKNYIYKDSLLVRLDVFLNE